MQNPKNNNVRSNRGRVRRDKQHPHPPAHDPWEHLDKSSSSPEEVLEQLRNEATLMDLPTWRKALYACLLLIAFIVMALLVAGITVWFTTSRRLDFYRYCLTFEGGATVFDALPIGGDNGTGYGVLEVDTHARVLDWWIVVDGLGSLATHLEIKGPLDPPNETLVSSSVYEDLGVDNSGNIEFDGSSEISTSKSKRLVKRPWLYYVLLRTAAHPNGAVRASIGSGCWINETP